MLDVINTIVPVFLVILLGYFLHAKELLPSPIIGPLNRLVFYLAIPAVIEVAAKAEVKQLAVFHHDPQHSDKYLDDLWVKYRSRYLAGLPKMDLFWAREGLTLAV